MTHREWIRAGLLSAMIVALSSLPYLIGYLCQSDELFFRGLLFNVKDSNTYLAAMQQGLAGSRHFQPLHTTGSFWAWKASY